MSELDRLHLRAAAVTKLSPHADRTVRWAYSKPRLAEAILILLPDFEYPDWDYRPVRELLRHVNRAAKAEGR